MSSEAERQFLDKIIAYANLSGLSDQLYLARLVALGLKDTGDVFFEDRIKGEYFLSLVSYFKEAKDKKYFSIIAPVGSRSYYEQYIPDPLLESDNKKLTTRNKSLTTRNRNLSSENKNLREENQLLQTQVDRLSSGEEFKALQTERDSLLKDVENLRSSKERLSREKDELVTKTRVFGYFKIALVFVLALALTMGIHFRNQFHALESDFNDRLASAEDRIFEAESLAKDIESQAAKKLQEALKSGTDSGYKSGYSDGYEEGKFDMYCWLEEKLIEARQLIESLRAQLAEQNEQESSSAPYSDSSRYADNQSSSPSSQSDGESEINEKIAEQAEKLKEMMDELKNRQGGVSSGSGSSSSSGNSSSSNSGGSSSPSSDSATTSYTVYITESGTKYHLGSCSYLSKSKIAIDKSKAISQGYTACSRCKP